MTKKRQGTTPVVRLIEMSAKREFTVNGILCPFDRFRALESYLVITVKAR